MGEPGRHGARRVLRGDGSQTEDQVAVEEPLEIRIAGDAVAITMRTPGDDRRLALGFLYAEGIIRSLDDVGTVTHCGRPGDEGYGNVLEVTAAAGAQLPLERTAAARRGTLTTASCGVCGRRQIDDLLAACPTLAEGPPIPRALVDRAPALLLATQASYARTGGAHAAAALDRDGAALAAFEDVGRHNAVDKVVGELLLTRRVGAAALLVVSGRSSFEIVQKAAMARIAVVVSVSAPTTLAIDLAERAGICLLGFVRAGGFNLYSHPERVLTRA